MTSVPTTNLGKDGASLAEEHSAPSEPNGNEGTAAGRIARELLKKRSEIGSSQNWLSVMDLQVR